MKHKQFSLNALHWINYVSTVYFGLAENALLRESKLISNSINYCADWDDYFEMITGISPLGNSILVNIYQVIYTKQS